MNEKVLLDLCKRMVLEHYNRYVREDEKPIINIEDVYVLKNKKQKDGVTEISLKVNHYLDLEYVIVCDSKKNSILSSYIVYTL